MDECVDAELSHIMTPHSSLSLKYKKGSFWRKSFMVMTHLDRGAKLQTAHQDIFSRGASGHRTCEVTKIQPKISTSLSQR